MSVSDKLFYNEASAAKLGWTPRWFGCKEFNDNLFAINKSISISIDNVIQEGVLLGISNYGELMINTGNNVLTINDINSTLRMI